jgi:tetratricopeptide (TPR) repeat protein
LLPPRMRAETRPAGTRRRSVLAAALVLALCERADAGTLRAVSALSFAAPLPASPDFSARFPRASAARSPLRPPPRAPECPRTGATRALAGHGQAPEGGGAQRRDVRAQAFEAARAGDPGLAVSLFAEYWDMPEAASDVAAMNADGAMKAQLGRLDDAIATFERALAASHDSSLRIGEAQRANTLFNLGNACAALSRHEDALVAFRQATELQPSDAQAVLNMGNAYAALGEHNSALEAFQRAVALDETSAIALLNCGNALCDAGRNAEGVMMLLEALEVRLPWQSDRSRLSPPACE